MKRLIAILLTVLLMGMFTACTQGDLPADVQPKRGEETIEVGETYTTFEGVSIQINNAIWTNEEVKFEIKWSNKTSYDVVYGENYNIEREENGVWESCVTIDSLAFTSIGYELEPGATQKKSYTLTNVFDISENGKYRFTTDCLVYEKGRGGESTECELWAEFTVTRNIEEVDVKKSPVTFDAQYVRTNGYNGGVKYPIVTVVSSVDELNAYYEANKDRYSLERRDGSAPGFLDACDKYDAAYFENQVLVMVLLEEGSGSIRHEVESVAMGEDGKCHISINRIVPEAGTADMAAWHILIEPAAGTIVTASDIVVYVDGVNPLTLDNRAQHARGYANIFLSVPYDWKYDTHSADGSNNFFISFWPDGQTEGKITVGYYEGFGVCGTGLEQEDITIAGYKARKGTYDGKPVWDFITLSDTPGQYVILNEGAGAWWNEYGDEAMQILETLKVADGIIDKATVIDLVKKDVTVEYNEVRADFDIKNGVWTLCFYTRNVVGGDQTFVVTHEGKVVDMVYGE